MQVPHVAALAPQDALESHHGRPVRLRMLVVETLDPELYVGAAQDVAGTWRCGKYGNTLALEPGHKHVFWERRPVRAIPVPGLSEWASESDGSGAGAASKLDIDAQTTCIRAASHWRLHADVRAIDMFTSALALRDRLCTSSCHLQAPPCQHLKSLQRRARRHIAHQWQTVRSASHATV